MKIDPVKKVKVQAKQDCEALIAELKYTRERYNKLQDRYERLLDEYVWSLVFVVGIILALSVFGIIFK